MRIKKRVLQKFVSLLSSALLLLNSFSPYLLIAPILNPSPVGAQVEVSPTVEPTATPTDTTSPTPTTDVTPTADPTATPTDVTSPTPTIDVTPTDTVTPEPTANPTTPATVTPTVDVSPTVTVSPLETIAPTEIPNLTPTEKPSVTSPPQNSSPTPGMSSEPSSTPSPTVAPVMTSKAIGDIDTNIIESFECRADSLNGCLITDKADYAPTDIAVITGHGFTANTGYTLRITSSDAPAVDSSYAITTDGTGSFTYSYQLDGNYRPNYLVEVKDAGGFVIASTTFTDSRTIDSVTLNGGSSVNVAPGASITANVQVTTSGTGSANNWESTGWLISTSPPGSVTCVDTNNHTNSGTNSESFSVTAPTTPGTYNAYFIAYSDDGSSNGCDNDASQTYVLSGSVTVTDNNVANPTLPQACGLDIALVLDNSTSIDTTELAQMKAAMISFTSALSGTPTQFSVTKFATTASVTQAFTSNVTDVNNAINAIPVGGGYTNWQDGLTKAQSTFDPRTNPNLVIFASDGNPNRTGTTGTTVSESVAVADAVTVANALKTSGTRILALGIGADLDVANMKAISGPTVGTNLSADVITSDFSTLASALATFASQTCGGTITVKKEVTGQTNPTLSGWHFTVNGHDYVTDSQGFTQAIPVSSGTYSVVETIQSGYSLATKTCTKNNNATGSPITNGVGSISVGANDIVSCTFTNSYNPVCGDGVVNGTEQCDAGNQNGVACTAEYGLTCNYCSVNCTNATVTGPSCGDGIKNGSEQCDGTDLGGLSSSEFSCTGQCGLNLIEPKVTICHAADSQTNPYITNQPNKSADVGGHDGHTGPIWYPGIADHGWGDIIPPFNYIGGSYPGKNWTTEGQAIYDAGCNIPKGHLVVKKTTIPSGDLTSFTISATSSNGGTITGGGSGTVTDANDKNYEVTPGTYSVTETVPEGWEETSNTCSDIAVGMGETKDCLITNTKKPKLTVTKVVKNDNGGEKVVSDFPLFVDGGSVTSGTTNFFSIGEHTVTETSDTGYEGKFSGDGDCDIVTGKVTLAAGDDKSCTITNDDKPGTLIVKKILTQDNGGGKAYVGFSYKINDGTSTPFDSDGINEETVDAGTYTVVEDSTTNVGYSVTYNNCTDVIVPNGGTQTCTITNDDIAPKLTLVKEVDNRDGGTATPSAWTLSATEVTPGTTDTSFSGAGPTVGPQDVDAASSYVLSESAGPGGYTAGAWNCDGGSVVTGADTRITLGVGDNVTCTIKNDDIAPKLTINKVCSPTGDSGKFNLLINGLTKKEDAACGESTGAVAVTAGKNTFGETNGTGTVLSEYKSTLSGTDCVDKDGNYEITLAVGDDKTCTITNTKNARIIVKKETNPDKSSQLFDFTANFSGDVFSLKDGESKDSGYSLTPGSSYHVAETGVEGWDQTDATCDNGDKIDNIIPSAGQTVTCTFTNTQRGTISGYKYNDADGSDSTTTDRTPIENWTIQLYQWVTDAYQYLTSTLTNVLGLFTFNNLVPGQYQVQEVVPTAGWTPVSPTGIPVTLGAGDEKKDNNFVNFQNATIVVHKNVVKPDGTTEVEDTKSFTALLNDGTPKTIAEGTNATYSDLTPGTYTVSEDTLPTGYALVSITDDDSTTPDGQVAVTSGHTNNVTITNRQLPATLTLVKHLPNDNGGTATQSSFKVYINDGLSTWGEHEVDPGSYTVKEDSLSGYTPSDWSNGCNEKGEVTLLPGQSKTCEITNDDIQPTLTIDKVLSPSTDPGLFSLQINGETAGTGLNVGNGGTTGAIGVNAGSVSFGEVAGTSTDLSNYSVSYSEGCEDGKVTLNSGDAKTCTITNTRKTVPLFADKYEDKNADGSRDSGENGLNGWTMQIFDNNECSGTPLLTKDTDSSTGTPGVAYFSALNMGQTYWVNEVEQTGWKSVTGNCKSVTMHDDLHSNNVVEFGNYQDAHIKVVKDVVKANGDPLNDSSEDTFDFHVATSSFSLADGENKIVDVKPGNYDVTESTNPNYVFGGCTAEYEGDSVGTTITQGKNVTVGSNDDVTVTCVNKQKPASLTITKDAQPNDSQEFTFTSADTDSGTLLDENFILTDDGSSSNSTTFNDLNKGTYNISENSVSGWNLTNVTCSQNASYSVEGNLLTVNLNSGDQVSCTFTNQKEGKVNVTKYNDKNGSGVQDEGENVLSDWTINLDKNSQQTGEDGKTTFDVIPGEYTLSEDIQRGWIQTNISCSAVEPTPTVTPTPTGENGGDEESNANICHYDSGNHPGWNALFLSQSGANNHLSNHSSDYPYGGPLASNGHPAQGHGADANDPTKDGEAWCADNVPTLTQGFRIFKTVNAFEEDSNPIDNDNSHPVSVDAGQTVNCKIGNRRNNPTLEISKSNDGFNKSQGSTVVYTLKVKAKDSKVLGVKLKDLLPKGFSFQHVISIIRNGVDDITSLVGDPAYHSPGTYNLGDMNEDDEIIIKYQAKVGDSQKFGIYKDVAWAEGTDVADSKVLALAQPEGKVSDNFVGTSVKVDGTISDQGSTTIAKEEGQVLGASTSLPATGASPAWLILALLLTVFGAISIVFGLMLKKGKVILTSLFVVMLFMFAGRVSAASSVSIRLSEPKTPTKTNNFTIDFVTLDLSDSGNPITVKCFYKKNLGDGWTQYGSDISVAAPGNSGSCQEVSSFVNTSETTYYFKATATNGVDSDDTEFQGLVSVGYDNRGPSAPTNYTKEKISSCQYKISFKTADDGMTSRVEIYRSENTTMTLDGSTKAGEVAVGPNTSSSFTDTVPDCSKSYYYVIRAFNVQGNSSAAIGDSVTISSGTTTTTTTSTTGGAIPVVNVTLPGGTAGTGSVLGEETKKEGSKEAEPQKKEEVINVGAKKDVGSVLGAITKKENRMFLIIGIILGAAIIGYVIYYFKKRKENPQI